MNTGIQILIERMKTNPEEFATPQHGGSAKWENIVRDYYEFLEEEDKAAYQQARRELVQGELTEVVMKKLAGVGEDDDVALSSKTLPPNIGSIRINHSNNQYEIFDGYQWIVTNQNAMYGQQQALRVSTQNNDINQLQNAYQNNPYQGMQQLGAAGGSGGTIYAGGGGGGGSMLGQLAKNLGFK